jgi:hypothetical protein
MEVEALCFKASEKIKRRAHTPENNNSFEIDLDRVAQLDYGKLYIYK